MADLDYITWQLSLQIPWLVNNPNGQAYANLFGTILNNAVSDWEQVNWSRMPLICPSDALPYLAQICNLIQGPTETEAHFRDRLQAIWNIAPYYGTGLGILLQLNYQGYPDGYLISSAGLVLSLQDPINESSANFPADQLIITYTQTSAFLNDGYYFSIPIRSWLSPIPAQFWDYTLPNSLGVQQNNRFILFFNTPPAIWSGGIPTTSQLNTISSIVNTWKGSRAIFEGVIVNNSSDAIPNWNAICGTSICGSGSCSIYLSQVYT